jgi:hypothetical protein
VHIELRLRRNFGGDAFDRIDHQVDHLVEVAPRERRIQGGPMRGPRVAFIGQQIDAHRGADGFVLV